MLIQLRKKATNLPGGLPYESDGDVRWKIKIKPWERPMWVWLKRKPTPKGGNTQTDMRARVCRVVPAISCSFLNVRFLCVQWQGVFFNFFMLSPKRYMNWQIWWLPVLSIRSETKTCNVHPQARRQTPPSLLYGTPPPPGGAKPQTLMPFDRFSRSLRQCSFQRTPYLIGKMRTIWQCMVPTSLKPTP